MRPTTPPQWFESSQTIVEASSSLFHQRACSKIPTAGTGMLGHYSYKVNIAFFFSAWSGWARTINIIKRQLGAFEKVTPPATELLGRLSKIEARSA